RAGHAVPLAENGLDALTVPVFEEDTYLAAQDEEDLLHLVRMGGVALAGRHEHDAEGEVLGRNVATVGLARGPVADEAMLGAPIAVDACIGECVPVGDSVSPTCDLPLEQLRQRF